MDLLLLVALIVANGLFAMTEVALLTAKRNRLEELAEEGNKPATIVLALHEDPDRFLSTIQIGITSIGILNGIVGQAILAAPFALWLQGLGMDANFSFYFATFLVVVVITYFSIVIGELVPKRIGQLYPENISRWSAHPMRLLDFISRPFVCLLSYSSDTILRLFGLKKPPTDSVTEEEIHAIIDKGSLAGIIEQQEREMLRNVFRLDDRQVGSLMVPRSEIVYIDVTLPLDDNLQLIANSEHSRFPVCRGGMQDVLGVITAKQLLIQKIKGSEADLAHELQSAVFVPETLNGMDLLANFRVSGMQMVLVVDEFGELQGLVTLQDVLEAVTGAFKSGNQDDEWAVQGEDGAWLLDGLIPVPELKDQLQWKNVPEEEKGRYHTLNGLLMWLLERLPQTGDVVEWHGWKLEVINMDGKRVDRVLATLIPQPEDQLDIEAEVAQGQAA